jgi:putative peptide zinc metalloprotease protein
VAPCAGTVIAPPRVPIPKLEHVQSNLRHWAGTPLDARNANCILDEQTHLLSIAPESAMQAILYLDQADRNDVSVGLKIALKFEHLPGRVFRGTIARIATAQADFVPSSLSVRHGGLLSTIADREGKEELQNAAYQAVVQLDESPEMLRTDLRGNARFIAVNRSAFGWLWRYVRRTFHFRM